MRYSIFMLTVFKVVARRTPCKLGLFVIILAYPIHVAWMGAGFLAKTPQSVVGSVASKVHQYINVVSPYAVGKCLLSLAPIGVLSWLLATIIMGSQQGKRETCAHVLHTRHTNRLAHLTKKLGFATRKPHLRYSPILAWQARYE